ncbi:MAG: LysM peptidoglycan-binding domain-containing protein [bacterium]|nr:LysM peptidoglycan-binding domain-containing protein [bacterium]
MHKYPRWVIFALLCMALGLPVAADITPPDAAAKPPVPRAESQGDVFPVHDSIRPNVEFWTRVFAEWTLAQVAIHDSRFPAVIYEIVTLPGAAKERTSREQRDYLDKRKKQWVARLERLERKVAAGHGLSDDEKRWALQLTEHGGSEAVRGAADRMRGQRGLRERFERGLEISHRYDAILRGIFRDAGLPEDLAYLPHVESSFQARARSSAGAVGVWQFTRGTGRRYLKITSGVDERLDPIAAGEGAARYLADAMDKLRSWPIALTSYNHGVQGMKRAVDAHGRDYETIFNEYDGKWFGFASRNFYAEFLAARRIASAPGRYFPDGIRAEAPLNLDRLELDRRTTPARLARAYDVPLAELASINPAWSRRAVKHGYALPNGMHVWLPGGTLERVARDGAPVAIDVAGWLDDDGRYLVQPGDTLSAISEAYGVPTRRLREMNGIRAGSSLIRVGQQLKLSEEAAEHVHVVRRGETLSAIAGRYGMTLRDLRGMNGMPANVSLIRSGQRLRVRGTPSRSVVHTVRRGDSLSRIAGRYGVRLSELLRLNRLRASSVIHPGQSIRIPR